MAFATKPLRRLPPLPKRQDEVHSYPIVRPHPSTKPCGRIEKWSHRQCLNRVDDLKPGLANELGRVFRESRDKSAHPFYVRCHFGQVLIDLNAGSMPNPCGNAPDLCADCERFLSECRDRDLLVIVASKTLELFLERLSTAGNRAAAPRTLPLHLFHRGSAFVCSELTRITKRNRGTYAGFSFGIAAGARSGFISAPAGDARLARRLLRGLPQCARAQFAAQGEEQLASRLDEDHGLLLRLLSQTSRESAAQGPWSCEIVVIPVIKERDVSATGLSTSILPQSYLRDAAVAHVLEGLPARPYVDRTVCHVLNMLCGETPGFRVAVGDEVVPMEALLAKFAGEFREDFGCIPLIFEPFHTLRNDDEANSCFYSPAAPTVLGPILRPRIYGEFFEELNARFERLRGADLLSHWDWKFYSFKEFDSVLGIEVQEPKEENFGDAGLDKFLARLRRILPTAGFDDVIRPTKAGFLSRFVHFSKNLSTR